MHLSDILTATSARGGWHATLQRLHRWAETRRQRAALAALDDRLLDDIGLPRHVAAEEASRPFWDAPEAWRR